MIQDENGGYYTPSLCTHIFKKQLFTQNMLKDMKIIIGEDGACVIPSVYHAESIVFVDKCLYNYCYNGASATKSKKVFDWDGPLNIYNHLVSKIDISEGDFKEQLYRKIVHELMHIVVSRFYQDKRYKEIKQDIKYNLKNCLIYKIAIRKASFKSLKGRLLAFAMRHNFILFFKLYSLRK